MTYRIQCQECNAYFDAEKKDRKYCSRKCYGESRRGVARPSIRKRIIKECKWCGDEFETGGRAGDKDQMFCSNQCASFARFKHADAKELSIPDAAYLAGIIDGEGSIFPIKRSKEGRNTWRLSVSSTDRELLEWIHEKTGAGGIYDSPRYKEHHSDCWQWWCYSWNVKQILEQALPYMVIESKRDSAMEMIEELQAIEDLN